MTYYVVGGGIGGLAFAISYTLSVQQQCQQHGDSLDDYNDLVVLDREVDESSYLSNKFTHSLSIRSHTGALGALKELGVLSSVKDSQSAVKVDYFAYSTPSGIFPAWSSDWMPSSWSNNNSEEELPSIGVRISKEALWKALYDRAIDLGITIRFNCDVKEVNLETGRIVLNGVDGADGEVVVGADKAGLVVIASGAWSNLANSTPLRNLPYAILGGMVTIPNTAPWPQHVHERNATIFSESGEAMMFLSHEQGDEVSMGVGFKVDKPIDRSDLAAVRAANQHGIRLVRENLPSDIASLFVDQVLSLKDGAPLLVNCHDRPNMTTPFQYNLNEGGSCFRSRNRVLRIGDAWHAPSPYAGVGANMAIVDGLELGRAAAIIVGTGGGSGGVDIKVLRAASVSLKRRWIRMLMRQSLVINFAHGTSWWMVTGRGLVLKGARLCLNPKWKHIRRGVVICLLAAAAILCLMTIK